MDDVGQVKHVCTLCVYGLDGLDWMDGVEDVLMEIGYRKCKKNKMYPDCLEQN